MPPTYEPKSQTMRAKLSATLLSQALLSYGLSVALLLVASATLSFVAPTPAWAQELCGDGVDNDGDGEIDEGFENVGDACSVGSTNVFGTCFTPGTIQCTIDLLSTECVLPPGVTPAMASSEALAANDLSCFDGVDNDCDGTADVGGAMIGGMIVAPDAACVVATEQFCNGLDDDNDGMVDEDFDVGTACDVGIGQCMNSGSVICDPTDMAQSTTTCSVSPGIPSLENTPGELRCLDGIDNDCDGLIDLADPSCQTAEVCDGVDNDGDGMSDEGFDLGNACTVGVGACQVNGVTACNAAGNNTQCNVVPLFPGVEGPAGTCSDGIDNDCDGFVDDLDGNCASADLAVSCSLVSLKKKQNGKPVPGTSCEEKFRLEIVSNADPSFLSAEIKGLNPDGTLIDLPRSPSVLPVQDGDELHLASRLSPGAWKVDKKGRFIDVFAPVPLVQVTANTGQKVVEAFCSPIPWMHVLKPSGQEDVVSASEGDLVDVVVPMPRVDPRTLAIVVDGVEILALLGIDPMTDFPNPNNPLGGVVDINGQMVTVSNLVVDAPSNLDVPGRNVLTMNLENLGGGGHIVVVNGNPRVDAIPPPNSAQCHLDDVLDAGTVSVFGITITEPTESEVLPAGTTTVSATIAHGRDIESAQIQGKPVDVGGQTCGALEFEAFGETFSVDSCAVNVSEMLPQTDLSMPLQIATIDLGKNIVSVGAQDDLLNTTFADRRFTSGVGSTVSPATLALSPQKRELLQKALELKLENAFANSEGSQPVSIQVKSNGLQIDLAFVFGVSTDGVNNFFQSSCSQVKADVEQKVMEALQNASFDPVTIPVDGGCDPTIRITGLSVELMGDLECNVDPVTDFMTVSVTLPDILFGIGVRGSCRDEFLGVCISEAVVDFQSQVQLHNFGFDFTLDEQLVLAGGQTELADFVMGEINIPPPNAGVELNCFTGFLADVVGFFTFGLVDFEEAAEDALESVFGDGINVDIAEALRSNHPDPLEVQKIELNEQLVQAEGIEAEQELLNIEITEEGFTGTIGASFTVPLPETDDFEAVVMSAPAPMFPIANAQEMFFVASDDIFNLLFAAIGLQGALTTECVVAEDMGGTPLTLEDTLPADCNSLVGADQFQTDVMRGRCHGTKGDDCTLIPNFVESFWCSNTKDILVSKNISKDTGLLFCANEPIAPRTLIRDNLGTVPVEAEIHANDVRITIALDRNADGMFDSDQFFPLAQGCVGLIEDVTRDCKWSDACFDLNLATEFTLGGGGTASAQIVRNVLGVSDSMGFQCSGGLNLGSGPPLLTEAGASDPVDTIGDNIGNIVKIFEALGLDMGGLVGFENPNVFSINVPGEDSDCSDCAEYLGVTGDIEIP